MGGKLPSAYEDNLLQTLQASRGGVTTDVMSALQRISADTPGDRVDGYVWSVKAIAEPTETETADADDFEPLAARQLVLQQSRILDMTQLEALDRIHAIAKRTEIVTPYSSMLVLVNDRQRELLRQAEANSDRFDREVEDGEDTLTQPNNLLNSTASVPEPEQVLGLGVCAIALILLKRKH